MGNQAAIDALAADAPEPGFLDAIGDFSFVDSPSLFGWASSPEKPLGQDEGMADLLGLADLPSVQAPLPDGTAKLGLKGVEVRSGNTTQTEDELLGKGSSQLEGLAELGLDGVGRVGVGGKQVEFGGDVQLAGGLKVGTDGRVDAGGKLSVLGNELAAQGSLDLDEAGRVESIGGTIGVKTGDTGFSAGMAYQFEEVELDGNTVSWSSGFSASTGAEIGGVGGSRDHQSGQRQSRSFATAQEAEDFLATVEQQGTPDNRQVGSAELRSMKPGTRISFSDQTTDGATLGVVGEVGQSATRQRDVEVVRAEDDRVNIQVRERFDNGAQLGVGNGILDVSAGTGVEEMVRMEYALDLSKPEDAEAFELFQQTGVMPDFVPIVNGEELRGVRSERGAGLPGLSVKQSGSIERGEVVADGRVSEVVRGSSGDEIFQGSRYDIPVATGELITQLGLGVGAIFDAESGLGFQEAGKRLGDWGRDARSEQFLSRGSRNGSESHRMTVQRPKSSAGEEGMGKMTIKQRQQMRFADLDQTARVLQDQVTPQVDREGIDPDKLPDHTPSDRSWVLDSVINEEGTDKIVQKLSDGYGFDLEPQAGRAIESIKRGFWDGGQTPEAFAEAMAELSYYGGEDALEGVRDIAGEENVERFLELEGDDAWVGKKKNLDLDKEVDTYIAGLETDSDQFRDKAGELVIREMARWARLQNRANYPEVPEALLQEELQRCLDRIDRLNGAMP